ncbi:hypothetical protein Pmani_017669 [Petrolisthes manimaculis]|uniref:RPA-interacting protein n=1 Tax=Petrolisthes manimaculis TaxID=1843537 RepID=A0AAE1PP09_9EUCA|nr:hypothetical protein Pmani_017669 [Petrolisthes manimaculis]
MEMETDQKGIMEKKMPHKRLYKNGRGRTPPWKEVYRKRCMERLRSSRTRLVDHFRSAGDAINNNNTQHFPTTRLVQDVMEVEWAVLNQTPFPSFSVAVSDDEIVRMAMEELQQELIAEEEKLLLEVLSYDAAALASKVSKEQTEEVICPVCKDFQMQGLHEFAKNDSVQVMGQAAGTDTKVVKCDCGLALQGANLTLNTVRSSLENTLSHHAQMCGGQMAFTSTTDTQGANVLITCGVCDWMSFLI